MDCLPNCNATVFRSTRPDSSCSITQASPRRCRVDHCHNRVLCSGSRLHERSNHRGDSSAWCWAWSVAVPARTGSASQASVPRPTWSFGAPSFEALRAAGFGDNCLGVADGADDDTPKGLLLAQHSRHALVAWLPFRAKAHLEFCRPVRLLRFGQHCNERPDRERKIPHRVRSLPYRPQNGWSSIAGSADRHYTPSGGATISFSASGISMLNVQPTPGRLTT